jgi:hypothetical protein
MVESALLTVESAILTVEPALLTVEPALLMVEPVPLTVEPALLAVEPEPFNRDHAPPTIDHTQQPEEEGTRHWALGKEEGIKHKRRTESYSGATPTPHPFSAPLPSSSRPSRSSQSSR